MEGYPTGVVVKNLAAVLQQGQLAGKGEAEAVARALINAAVEYADQTTKDTPDTFSGKHRAIFSELEKQIKTHIVPAREDEQPTKIKQFTSKVSADEAAAQVRRNAPHLWKATAYEHEQGGRPVYIVGHRGAADDFMTWLLDDGVTMGNPTPTGVVPSLD